MAKALPPAPKKLPAIYRYNPFYVLQRKTNRYGISLAGSHKIHDPLFKFHPSVQQPHDFGHVTHLLGFIYLMQNMNHNCPTSWGICKDRGI